MYYYIILNIFIQQNKILFVGHQNTRKISIIHSPYTFPSIIIGNISEGMYNLFFQFSLLQDIKNSQLFPIVNENNYGFFTCYLYMLSLHAIFTCLPLIKFISLIDLVKACFHNTKVDPTLCANTN